MAQINSQSLKITVTELVPNGFEMKELLDSESVVVLKQAVEDLVGRKSALVEIDLD
jgi:hypothetical protein